MPTESASPERSFDVRFDAEDDILHMRLDGFWTLDTFDAYVRPLAAEAGRLRMQRRRYDMLSDSRGFAVQSAEVTARFDALAKRAETGHGGRTAIVVASRLNKMQAGRALASDRVRVFLDMDEARQWLIAERTRDPA